MIGASANIDNKIPLTDEEEMYNLLEFLQYKSVRLSNAVSLRDKINSPSHPVPYNYTSSQNSNCSPILHYLFVDANGDSRANGVEVITM
jgi:hypothetical protein